MSLIVHRGAERRFAPWKNGGGETAEILCHPPGAGMEDFGWRISTARVAQSGPFSHFPGVARWLAVIEGGRLNLVLSDRRLIVEAGTQPVLFDGDSTCECTLEGREVLDLNLMTRFPFVGRMRPSGPLMPPLGRHAATLVFLRQDRPTEGLSRLDLRDVTNLDDVSRNAACGPTDLLIEVFDTTA